MWDGSSGLGAHCDRRNCRGCRSSSDRGSWVGCATRDVLPTGVRLALGPTLASWSSPSRSARVPAPKRLTSPARRRGVQGKWGGWSVVAPWRSIEPIRVQRTRKPVARPLERPTAIRPCNAGIVAETANRSPGRAPRIGNTFDEGSSRSLSTTAKGPNRHNNDNVHHLPQTFATSRPTLIQPSAVIWRLPGLSLLSTRLTA
jgi:hypothetical protein